MPITQTEGYFRNPYFLGEPTLFLLTSKWNLQKKAFYFVKTNINSNFAVNLAEILKEAIINFCLFDELQFSNIRTL